MPGKLTLIVDAAFGSCGKGSVMSRMSGQYDYAVRTGAIQAGHIIYLEGKRYAMQSIPCLWIDPNCKLVIGANGMISKHIFDREIEWIKEAGFETEGRIFIDPAVGIIDESHAERERARAGEKGRGSTREGVGEATADKVRRLLPIARDTDWCQPYLLDTVKLLNDELKAGKRVIIEGTQGAGLSLSTGRWDGVPFYPQCTSREVTPAGLMADCGLCPGIAKYAEIETIAVLRTYPIRIAGDSGPMGNEITWDEVTERSGSPTPILEMTTVTKKVRRVAEFNMDWTKEVLNYINPDKLVVTFIDYIDYRDFKQTDWNELSIKSKEAIALLEKATGVPVWMIGTGPNPEDHIILNHHLVGVYLESQNMFKEEVDTITGIKIRQPVIDELKPVYESKPHNIT